MSKPASVLNPFNQAPVVDETKKQSAAPSTADEIREPAPTTAESEVIYGYAMEDLAFLDVGLNQIPEPPKFILDKLDKRDLKWRWLSRPAIKHIGTRGYTVYVAESEDRARIDRGEAGGTIYLSPEYYVCWREDAILGVTPRRLYEARRAEKLKRTIVQSKLARNTPGGLVELAKRVGGRVASYDVDEFQQEGE